MGIRLGLCQTRVTRDKGENLRLAEAALRQAADQGPTWPCRRRCSTAPTKTPASPSTGSPPGGDLAVPGRHGPGAGAVPGRGALCRSWRGDKVYNTCYLFSPQGEELARHRKVHLFDIDVPGGQRFKESDTLAAGNQITVVDTPLGTLGLAICFDIRFAELFRVMGDRGAQLILVPAAFNMTTGPVHWDLAFRMRALDQQCFVAGCPPPGTRRPPMWPMATPGVQPLGEILAQLDEKPGVQVVDIDLGDLAKYRSQIPILSGRRGDLYRTEDRT